MIETMKAALFYGVRDVRVEEAPVNQPESDQALIKIEACGICPTDMKSYTGVRKTSLRGKSTFPRVLGHEWVGEIVQVGRDFHGFGIGDRVAADWRVACGSCHYCKKGMFNYCLDMQHNRVVGGFCAYGIRTARNMRLIPDSVSYDEAVFTEPLACCTNGNKQSNISMGDDVVVIGASPIGLQHLQLAKRQGARMIVSELLKRRLRVPKELGADDTVCAQ